MSDIEDLLKHAVQEVTTPALGEAFTEKVLRATVGEDERKALAIGRALWEGDVGVNDVATAWEKLFGEPFDKAKAVEKQDLGDAIGYVMPGGFVVFDDTYDTNHGIYAPPRACPEGSVWGLEIAPRGDPVVKPVVLPEGYVMTDDVRKVYQRQPTSGEEHTAKSRKFVFSAWHGIVYVLSGDERNAARERLYYQRTTQEVVLDEVKTWVDRGAFIGDGPLRDAVDRWYVPYGRECYACKARGRVHPTTVDEFVEVGGKKLYVANVPAMKCGACHDYWIGCNELGQVEREAAARALRYYGPTPENLRFARKALGYVKQQQMIDCKISGDQAYAWEQGGRGNLDKLPEYASYLVERLETTW